MQIKQYRNEIIEYSCLPYKERGRVRRDLEAEMALAMERGESPEEIMARMGDPREIGQEIMENYYGITELPYEEYRSEATAFGLPLVHIVRMKKQSSNYRFDRLMPPRARGVLALGRRSAGVVSLGVISLGLVSLGMISLGLFSFAMVGVGLVGYGAVQFGLLLAIGNVVAGLCAAGNVAIGIFAAGNVAVGRYAAGNVPVGMYAIGNEPRGTYIFALENISAQGGELASFINGLPASDMAKRFLMDASGMGWEWGVWQAVIGVCIVLLALALWLALSRRLLGKRKAF